MIIQIDISGQIQQKNFDSALGFKRSDGLQGAVYLPSKTKKEILKKYKGQVVRLIEKVHCILIYYSIKNHLDGVKEIIICKDVNYRRLKDLVPLIFKDKLQGIKIKPRVEKKKSNGHRPAIRAFRKRMRADKIVTKDMVESVLFEFKRKV
jgi:hypothetical protein